MMSFKLVCYLNFGYPTIKDGLDNVEKYYKCGCRAIQLDLPSADPYLEQPAIRERMTYCLQHNPDYDTYLNAIEKVYKKYPDMDIYLMLYADIVNSIGLEKLITYCHKLKIINVSALGADDEMKNAFEKAGFTKATYVQLHIPESELEAAREADMVMYQVRPLENQAKRKGIECFADGIKYLRDAGINKPILATVGIKSPDDIRMVKKAGASGAFIGSVLMKNIDDEELLKKTLIEYVAATE